MMSREQSGAEQDRYLAHGTGLQGAGFLSLTPHLGALPPSHQDAPGKSLPTVNSNDPRKDVKWDDPLPVRGARFFKPFRHMLLWPDSRAAPGASSVLDVH